MANDEPTRGPQFRCPKCPGLLFLKSTMSLETTLTAKEVAALEKSPEKFRCRECNYTERFEKVRKDTRAYCLECFSPLIRFKDGEQDYFQCFYPICSRGELKQPSQVGSLHTCRKCLLPMWSEGALFIVLPDNPKLTFARNAAPMIGLSGELHCPNRCGEVYEVSPKGIYHDYLEWLYDALTEETLEILDRRLPPGEHSPLAREIAKDMLQSITVSEKVASEFLKISEWRNWKNYERDLEHALQGLNLVKQHGDLATKQALISYAIVCYIRPFSGNDVESGPRNLDDRVVPGEFKPLHNSLRDARNQQLAHTDPKYYKARLKLWQGNVEDAITMMFRGSGLERFLTQAPEIEKLVTAVRDRLRDRIKAYEKHIVSKPAPPTQV